MPKAVTRTSAEHNAYIRGRDSEVDYMGYLKDFKTAFPFLKEHDRMGWCAYDYLPGRHFGILCHDHLSDLGGGVIPKSPWRMGENPDTGLFDHREEWIDTRTNQRILLGHSYGLNKFMDNGDPWLSTLKARFGTVGLTWGVVNPEFPSWYGAPYISVLFPDLREDVYGNLFEVYFDGGNAQSDVDPRILGEIVEQRELAVISEWKREAAERVQTNARHGFYLMCDIATSYREGGMHRQAWAMLREIKALVEANPELRTNRTSRLGERDAAFVGLVKE